MSGRAFTERTPRARAARRLGREGWPPLLIVSFAMVARSLGVGYYYYLLALLIIANGQCNESIGVAVRAVGRLKDGARLGGKLFSN